MNLFRKDSPRPPARPVYSEKDRLDEETARRQVDNWAVLQADPPVRQNVVEEKETMYRMYLKIPVFKKFFRRREKYFSRPLHARDN